MFKRKQPEKKKITVTPEFLDQALKKKKELEYKISRFEHGTFFYVDQADLKKNAFYFAIETERALCELPRKTLLEFAEPVKKELATLNSFLCRVILFSTEVDDEIQNIVRFESEELC